VERHREGELRVGEDPFKYRGLFFCSHTLRKASNMLCSAYLAVWAKIPMFRAFRKITLSCSLYEHQ
jgi:hypothetical protein